MFKKIIIYALCFGFVQGFVMFSLRAQDVEKPITLRFEPQLSGEIYRFNMQSTGDSYYFSDIWLNGDVLLESGKTVLDESLKYNIYTDELVWMSGIKKQQVKVEKELVKGFTINIAGEEKPLVFKKIPLSESLSSKPKNTFLQELYEGEVSLMAHRRVIKSGKRLSRSGKSLISVINLRLKPIFYIVTPDNEIIEIGRFKKLSLYRIFSDNRDEIRKAFRSEKISIQSEADLIRAVAIIDRVIGDE